MLSTSSGNSEGYGQDSVGSELGLAPSPLVCGSVKLLDHLSIDDLLFGDVHTLECWADDVVDVLDSLDATLSEISVGVLVSELEGFVNTCGRATWDCSSVHGTIGEEHVSLDSWISSGIENFSGLDGGNGGELPLGVHEGVGSSESGEHGW